MIFVTPEGVMGKYSERASRSVDEVFGEAEPRLSADERDSRSPADDDDHDRWLRDNRPPHHG